MAQESYFIIRNSDGDTYIEEITKEKLEERLSDEDYYGPHVGFIGDTENSDTNYWGDNMMIIKGSIVVPKPVEKVTKYEL